MPTGKQEKSAVTAGTGRGNSPAPAGLRLIKSRPIPVVTGIGLVAAARFGLAAGNGLPRGNKHRLCRGMYLPAPRKPSERRDSCYQPVKVCRKNVAYIADAERIRLGYLARIYHESTRLEFPIETGEAELRRRV